LKTILILGLLAAACSVRSEIIDRIAVAVGNQVVTTSDLDREIRVTAFLNQADPDFSPAARRKTAGRMVEQRLIRRELQLSRYPAPALAEAEPVLKQFIQEHYPTAGAYQEALRARGLTDDELRQAILWQLTLLRFIDDRFRAGANLTEDDIRDYFEKVIKPAAQKVTAGPPPELEDYRERITAALEQQQVDQELETWLDQARKRTGVEYIEEAFQ
jgi:parvulin-like peptidyl-prolyl isomerase